MGLEEPEEYLLGFSTEAGADELDLFFVFFFWVDGWSCEFAFFSGEDGLGFFFAGEFDGDCSLSSVWEGLSDSRRGLLIPFRISVMLDDSSWE